jgi:hypothetical protein
VYSTLQRKAQYETIRSAGLSRDDYRTAIKKLNKAEMKYRTAQKTKAKKEAQAERERQARATAQAIANAPRLREAEAKKRAEKNAMRRERAKANKYILSRIKQNTIFRGSIEGDEQLNNIYKGIKGNTTRFTTPTNDVVMQVPTTYKEFRSKYLIEVEEVDYEGVIYTTQILISEPSDIPASTMEQAFREGITHCVFQPLIDALTQKIETVESKDCKKRYARRIYNLKEASVKYEEGVPISDMEAVAVMSGYCIYIYDIFGKVLYTFNEKGRLGKLSFTNTRPNHIDEGFLVLQTKAVDISVQEMSELYDNVKKSGEFFMIQGDIKNNLPRRISMLRGVFQLENPSKEYFDTLNDAIDINSYRFNASKYPEVNDFIKEGRVINSWVCNLSDEKPTAHLDMPKAYAQFKKCSYYQGFLGMIHQWRLGVFTREFITKNIGIYRFRVKACSNELFKKLGLSHVKKHFSDSEFKNSYTLPSPEILFFLDHGVQMEIYAGVWGSKFDFDFTNELLEDRRYCEWAGRLSMEYQHSNYSFKCSQEWASHLKVEYGDDVFYWADEGICSVRIKQDNVFTTHHILAFITSYVRIQMMQAMLKFDHSQLIKVVLDGLYFKGDAPLGLEWFKPKELKEHSGGFGWYSESETNIYDWKPMRFAGNTLITGQGGSGKTYSILTDTGFNKILFVTPQHVLGGDVKKKYGVAYTTIHKLIGIDCRPWIEEHSYPPVILIDEITQIASDWIDGVFQMYPKSLIILAGDIDSNGQWFQCRNGCPGEFSTVWKPHDVEIIEMLEDRRSQDDELKALKLEVRAKMRDIFTNGDSGENEIMKDWACRKFKPIMIFEASEMFKEGDAWIAGTHRTSELLLKLNVVSGYYKQGGFISSEPLDNYKKRGSFTIHSYQGKTLDTGKIFISICDMFEYAMLYTAISRAVNFNQLVFVM